MAVNPLYTPGELEYLRQFRQGQVPSADLLGDPVAPEATYADLYGPAPANDPGAGLPAEALAGPAFPVRDTAAEQRDRDAQVASLPDQAIDVSRIGAGGGYDPLAAEGRERRIVGGLPEASDPLHAPEAAAAVAEPTLTGAAEGAPPPPAPMVPIADAVQRPPVPVTSEMQKVAPTVSGRAEAGPSIAARRAGISTGRPRDPLWEERYARAGGRDPRFAPLGIPITPGEADSAMTRARQVGNLQVEQTEEMLEAGRQMAEADSAAEAMKAGYVEEQARRDRERTDILEGAERNMRSLLDEVTAEPIDSQRHWNSKNTGEKILSSIAVGLGALGSGLTGAPNFAFEKLQSEIRNDIEAQKANKAFAQSRAMAEGSLIQLARDRFDDERMQDLSMQQAAWNLADKELERFGTLVKAPAQQTAIEEMRTKIAAEQESLGREFRTALDSYALARIAARQKALAAAAPKVKKPPRNEVALLIEGLSTQDGIIKKLGRVKELTGTALNRVWGTAERGSAETLVRKLQLDYKRGEQTGTLDKGSLDFFDSMIGTPSDFFRNPASEAKIDQLIQDAEARKIQLQREYETLQGIETGAASRGTGVVK